MGMRYTINFQQAADPANVAAECGIVRFNGAKLLPHEAAMLASALAECADKAESKAAEAAATIQPVAA
jgi:hypothetical protein